jgi:hypothetical protein
MEWALAAFAFVLAAWLIACLVNADRDRTYDDSYITYLYGRNLAEGHGLRYNPTDAEPTSGTSSLLHVLVSAAAIRAGLEPLFVTRALAIASLFAMAIAFGAVGSRLARVPLPAGWLAGIVVVALWGMLPDTRIHLGTGMETLHFTALHGLLAAWAVMTIARDGAPRSCGLAFAGALAILAIVLARPEGVWLAAAYVGAIALLRALDVGARRAVVAALPMGAWTLAVFGAFVAWHCAYFGHCVPNTYYVKAANALFGSDGSLLPGLETTLRFAAVRWFPLAGIAFGLAVVVGAPRAALRTGAVLALPSLLLIALYARAIHEMTGGFRFEYPMLAPPVLALVVAACALRAASAPRFYGALSIAGVALPLLAAPTPAPFWHWLAHPRSSAIAWLPPYEPTQFALARAGLDLGESGLGQEATILVSAAGRVPYYSRFRAVDLIGLNDNRLCGREPMTIEEMWRYVEAQEPDAVMSILPPAAPGSTDPAHDPNFQSASVQRTLSGRGSALFEHWNRARVAESFWREMRWIRDHCEFGAAYKLGDAWGSDWAVLLYVRRDSPHRDRIVEALARGGRGNPDIELSRVFPFDPRALH